MPKKRKSWLPEGKHAVPTVFETEDYERLKAIAEADRRSLAEIIRRAVRYWLQSEDAKILATPLDERIHAHSLKNNHKG